MAAGSAAAALRRIARETKALPREMVEDAANNVVLKAINTVLAAHTGGDYSLSHAPGKLKVDVKITGGGSTVTATVTPGPKRGVARWGWLEDGTKPHAIGRGMHPGTEGKRTWSSAVDQALLNKVIRDANVKWVKVVG